MKGCSAIIFPGGEDISPSLYAHPEPVECNEGFSPERDVSDFLLMSYCLDQDIPMLCICRGTQVLSVVSGAEIIQDISTYIENLGQSYSWDHRSEPETPGGYRDFTFHDVQVTNGSLLKEIVQTDVIPNAASWHHQAVKGAEGTLLTVTGTSMTAGTQMILRT